LTARSWKLQKLRARVLLERALKRSNALILHSHFGDRGWANIAFARSNNLHHVVTFYGYDASRLPTNLPKWRDRYKDLFDSADAFLCEGPFLGQTLQELGCPGRKIHVHHLGVPVDSIEFRPFKYEPEDVLRILIAGTFVQKKGIPTAIKALGLISDKVDLQITIVGDSNGQQRSEQEKQAIFSAVEEAGLKQSVQFLGYQRHDDLLGLAYKHHVFLSPSEIADDGDSEGGAPVSLIEMAATGIQIVSTTHCDIPNVIIDGETGHLAAEKDASAIAEKLLFLDRNRSLWIKYAENARRRISTEFDSHLQGQRLGRFYEKLINDEVVANRLS
jgi:colanic acid/amylovoran biosynthesis glycosyltransferase